MRANGSDSRTTATGGFEARLWTVDIALPNDMDVSEYKHVVPVLIFLKYIADVLAAKHAELKTQHTDGTYSEDLNGYRAAIIVCVPKEARQRHLKTSTPRRTIVKLVDLAMATIELGNPWIKWAPHLVGQSGLEGRANSWQAAQATLALNHASP